MGLFTKKNTLEEELTPVEQVTETDTIPAEDLPASQATEHEIVNTYSDEMGIIAEGTTIHGDIKTKGHLAVVGIVEGNVTTAGNLMLAGVIKGTIKCNNIVIDGANHSQTIHAQGSVSIKENTVINAPIFCKHISIMGTVVGNIKASGNIGLAKTAVVKGDMSSSVLAVEPGAKIQGTVTVK